jgi:acetyl esterase/lipase
MKLERRDMSTEKLPFNVPLAYSIKTVWAIGERALRLLVLNRRAPQVAGIEREIHYVPHGHRLQTLDIIRPLGEPPFPVLIYVHGGAQMVGDKGTYERICKCFAAAGYLVFNVNYRMSPRWGYPEQVQDAAAAISCAYENISSHGGDPNKIFFAGDSAGAYLSTMYTAMTLDEELMRAVGVKECIPADVIKGLLLFYGVYNLAEVGNTKFPFTKLIITGFLGTDPEIFAEKAKQGSPVNHVSSEFPPCYLASSELDPLHEQTEELVRALDEKGVTYEYFNLVRKKYPLTYHGFLNFWWFASARRTMQQAIEFLKKYG